MDDGGRCLLDVINDPQLLQSFLENNSNNNNTTQQQTNSNSSSTSNVVVSSASAAVVSNATIINASTIVQPPPPPPLSLSTISSTPSIIINQNKNDSVFNTATTIDQLSMPSSSSSSMVATTTTTTQPIILPNNNNNNGIINPIITIPKTLASQIQIVANNNNQLMATTISTTPTTTATNKPVRARKSTAVATKSNSSSKSIKNQQMTNLSSSTTIPTSISSISGILGSSNIATSIASNTLVAATPTFLNSTTGLIPITSLATTGGAGGGLQGLIFAGSHLTHSNATSNVQSIRHPSTFVSTPQFQLGPRPMTVLPQPFILPGGLQLATNGSNNQQQFVFARPSLSHQQHQTTGPQLLQIIQTSQGPQLIAQAPSAPIQTIATSNHIQTINVQQQQQQTSTVLTPTTSAAIITKNSKGSNKQILPKPNSAKNSKTNHQQNQIQNQNNNNSQNIKFIQTPTVGGTANPFTTSTNQNATQFIIGGGGGVSGGIHQNHQPQLIAGPNGTFFLSNNNLLHTNTGQTQFSQQPQFLLQNQQLLAIRPSSGPGGLAGQTFLVNPNALTTAANNLNNNNDQLTALNQLTIPQSSSIINTNKSSTTTSSSSTNITHHHATSLNHILLNQNTTPIVSQASGLTAFRQQQQQTPGNLIIRPQIIGQQPPTSLSSSTTTVNNNSTPQLIQIQTPNGPILLSVNLNSSQQQQQQQPSQPQIQQPQTPQPQTIQIDNTLYSLTTNPVNQQQQPTTLNLGGGGAATLSQAILTNQTHNQQQQQLLTHHHQNFSSNQQLHQQQTILSSSNNNQKNQTTTTTITKPKTQNPTKGLNLADLLKETGILTEFSPPTSPISITQTKDNNNSANVLIDPLTRISTPSSQSQTILMVSNSNNNLSTTATTTNAVAAAANTALVPSSLQSQTQQLRISLTPDGTIVLLSPNSNTLLPTIQQQQQQQGINNLTAATIIGQTKNTNSKQQQQQTVVNDSSGLGSSQPSPDSTTPSIDTGSCSSPSTVVTTQTTQSLSTQTIKNINSIDSKSLDNNTVDDTVVSSLSSTNQSSLKTLTSSTATTTTTTCTADTSSINQSIKPSHLMNNNTSLVLSQQPTLPLMTSNQTSTTTYTTILIPGTIMFLNDKRIPIATLNRTNQIGELMQRLDNQIKQNILQQQQQQPKDLQQELQQLQQTLLLIQSQPIIPSQIPQVKISDKIAQLLQISTWATQSTQIKTSPQTIAVVNHNQSSIGTTITTTTTTTTTTSITTPTTVKFVLGPKINSNSIQLVHSISNSSPINPLSSSSSSPSTTAKQTTTLTATDSIQSPDLKTQITTSPVITTPIIVKQEKPKSNILKAIQSQLHADQNTALHPDCRTPFRSRDDACKRLLRYHVFDQQQFSEKQLQKFDELFEQASQTLLYKRQQLYDKFRYLIIKDSMKCSPSCEQVMVNRIIIDEENAALKSDKELVASGGVLDLPPLPENWLEDSLQQQQDIHKNDEDNIRQKHSLFDTDELMNVDYFDNITLKRKFEEDNSAADFLLESSTTTTTTNLFTTTSSELNSDLNALCDIFDEESIADPTSIKNDNNDVDKLIKLHSPIDTNNDSDFLGIDGLNDHNNNDDDDDNDSLLRCNNQNFDDSNRAITDVDDDLEALYSNITDTSDLIGNNQNSLLWPNDSNHHHNMLNSTTDSLSHNNHHHRNQDHFLGRSISTGGGGQSSLSWSTRSYGNVNETEAAVAVQSIIGGNDDNDIPTEDHDNDGTMDFSSLELSDNVHGDNTTATSNNHFGNEDLFPNDHQSFDDNVRESSTAIDTTNFIQNSMTNNNNNTSAADMQMNCAIKSIMMPSDSYHINNDNMSSSSTSSLNNELSYQHQNHHHHHHQQQTSMMLPTSTISTSTNMMNRFSSSNNSMMMMNSFNVPSTMSHVNDPMLDEAVKSIL